MSTSNAPEPARVLARLDRISVWALPGLFIGIIGVGFLFTFYDMFDVNVSFIQTCTSIVAGCTPKTAASYIGLPILLNLVGYVAGALVLAPLSDRFGRRDMLLVTMLLTGIGSLATAFATSYWFFIWARAFTGLGVGADLAIVNTYIGEVAPVAQRGKYTSLIVVFSAFGAFFGIWLALWLTTPATPWPLGLPFAVAGPGFDMGWRIMYVIGAALGVIGVALRFQIPESPRWLVSRGKVEDAAAVVADMEERAELDLPEVRDEDIRAEHAVLKAHPVPYVDILTNRTYLFRAIWLAVMWFLAYMTIYAYAEGMVSILTGLNYPPPEAGLITAFGTFGFIACALFAFRYGERLDRHLWIIISALITLAGSLILGLAGHFLALSLLGAAVIFFGFNLWVPLGYAWTAEHFPHRARATGFGLTDGIGHIGGGVGILLIAPLLPQLDVTKALVFCSLFLFVAWIVSTLGVKTRARPLEEVSP